MKYRAEIDGLRTIAIIPVILFHAGFKWFSGGFVGVDVFFVISGYLITTIILTEKEQGIFSLVNFYERRARRILPALFFVMLISLPFAWMWLQTDEMIGFSKSLVGVSIFSSNILFWSETGYWGTANELKPLLHTWSLSVEEQYYILFPLYLMVMWRFRKRWILGSFMVIAAISLGIAQWGSNNFPVANFFLLPSRAWELALGASIAFYFLYRKQGIRTLMPHKIIDESLSLLGLLMIAYAVFAFDGTVPFPGFYALIPTVGAGLIILFSSGNTLVGRLLGTQLFVSLGLISYSTYLWHQPLFSFARNRSLMEPSALTYAGLAVLSIIFGYLSWRYIEKPFRKAGVFSRKTIFTFSGVGTVLFVVVGLVGQYNKGFPERFKLEQSILDDFANHKLRRNCKKNEANRVGGEHFCKLGVTTGESSLRFAVFGDSHSGVILPAFDSAARSVNTQFIHIGEGGCPPLLGADVAKGNYKMGVCENLALKEFEYVRDHKINKVFLVASWALYTDGNYDAGMERYFLVDKNSKVLTREASRAVFANAIEVTADAYRNIGASVYIVEQIPQQIINIQKLYYRISNSHAADSEIDDFILSQSVSRSRSNDLQAYNREVFGRLASKGKVTLVNLDNYYCSAEVCLIGNKNHSHYRDDNHVSAFGASLVIGEIVKHIK